MYMYCVFCRSGSEMKVSRYMKKLAGMDGFKLIVPCKVLSERRGGQWREIRKALFPGYIFMYNDTEIDRRAFSLITNFYKMLKYGDGTCELAGIDAEIAQWLYDHDGDIVISDVEFTGKSVRIISGPLKDVAGVIERVDRRKRRVYVRTEFAGHTTLMTMGINDLEMMD